MSKLFANFGDYKGEWPWKNFTSSEVACKHCGELYFDPDSMDALQSLREAWGKPIVINSAHRCPVHNRAVGGVDSSQHLKIAFDCICPRGEQAPFVEAAREAGFTGIGRYPGRGFVHLDLGPKREWVG